MNDALTPTYAPEADGAPDPGEIVWAWVPFEEDPSQGKDRPVLLLCRTRDTDEVPNVWLGLQLTSQDHDRDAADEEQWGRHWMDIGSGPWDPRGRASEVRLDRAILLDDASIRREGAALDKPRFDEVVAAAARFHDAVR